MIKIGLIGCGTAMESLHLPAVARSKESSAEWLVDVDVERVESVAQRYDIPNVSNDYTAVDGVDAVIIGTPHYLHVPMTEHFLDRGVHVLCEKPFTIKAADAERLVALARARHLTLSVGVFRRYYPVAAFLRRVVETDWLGKVDRIDAEEGAPYGWEPVSSFQTNRHKAGGGVLIDTGSHTIDRILWMFGCPRATLDSYQDSSETGVESDCVVRFSIPWRDASIPVRVELSRTRTLRNTFQVFTTLGVVEAPVNDPTQAWFTDTRLMDEGALSQSIALDLRADLRGHGTNKPIYYFDDQLNDFCEAIRCHRTPANSGESVLSLIHLIESCYENRQPLAEPWTSFTLDRTILSPVGAQV